MYAKSDALPLHILFSPLLLFPVFLPLGTILFGPVEKIQNGFFGLFLNLLFTSLLDLRLHQLLLDFCQRRLHGIFDFGDYSIQPGSGILTLFLRCFPFRR